MNISTVRDVLQAYKIGRITIDEAELLVIVMVIKDQNKEIKKCL